MSQISFLEQQSVFEAARERERIEGSLAAKPENTVLLNTLRSMAREICGRNGTVCIDDVRRLLIERGYELPQNQRLFGLVFKTKEFVFVKKIESTRPERIARAGHGASGINVYRMRGAA